MATSMADLYWEFIINKIIKDLLADETAPTFSNIMTALDAYTDDYNIPQFEKEDWSVTWGEESSAAKFNATMNMIHQDLTVLYDSLIDISAQSTSRFERWRAKAKQLEKRTNKLAERLTSLLLVTQDTEGYVDYFQENFNDFTWIDQNNTTANVDIQHNIVTTSLSSSLASSGNPTKFNSSYFTDIAFNLLTDQYVSASSQVEGTQLSNIFDNTGNYWQQRVYTSKPITLSCEIKVKLTDGLFSISRIDVDLHQSNIGVATNVLPLYSTDGKIWKRIASQTYALDLLDTGTFQLEEPINAKYFKFILTKTSPDMLRPGNYIYEFGVDEISFFKESFNTSTTGYDLISKPIYINSTQSANNVKEFSQLTLSVCERIEDDTFIDYYIAASNSSTMDPSTATWMSIDPLTRSEPKKPTVINFSETNFLEHRDISISMDPLNSNSGFVNPKQTFSMITDTDGTTSSFTSSAQRYVFANPEDRILSLQISNDVSISDGTLEIWRNIPNGTNLVRDVQSGWGFHDDFYTTIMRVENGNGVEIDFGENPIIINEQKYSGKITIPYGNHSVKVFKQRWREITGAITTLSQLKAADPLYPYNHRYLIEGFNYGTSWTEEKVYYGADTIAEYLMTQVSPFDIINGANVDNYSIFAIDTDAVDTGRTPSTNTAASKVFLLKVDYTNTDFMNELFTIRFRPSVSTYTYCLFKAVLKTTNSETTPALCSYRLKFGLGTLEE